ncbi:MAG TPA: radical SAM protein, partial [Bryobacteraceae bacterium]|nr:radical SAM protein [Bryobacteraceae bacterium]
LDSGVSFHWTFQASTDLLCRMSDEDVALLGASGVSHIGFGTESASPEILEKMNKRHQNIADIAEAARKCAQAGIRVTLNLIFGYPGEEESHRRETLRVMGDIAARFDNVTFSPNVFVPYPGIPIWPQLRDRGLREPETLAGWADIDLGSHSLPWLGGRAYETLQRGISYFLLANQLNKIRRKSNSAALQSFVNMLRRPLHWRLRHHCFGWPVELWLSMANEWLVVRRSLLTGQALSHGLTRTG